MKIKRILAALLISVLLLSSCKPSDPDVTGNGELTHDTVNTVAPETDSGQTEDTEKPPDPLSAADIPSAYAPLSAAEFLPEEYYAFEGGGLTFALQYSLTSEFSSGLAVIDGLDVTRFAVIDGNGASINCPEGYFSKGEHNFTLFVSCAGGISYAAERTFYITDKDDLKHYTGEIHSHTTESDGIGTVLQAYEYARNTGGVDFFAVTDHSTYINRSVYLKKHIDIANECNKPGEFVALYGYEDTWNMTTGFWGHINILNTDKYLKPAIKSLTGVYEYADSMPGAVAMFNHPSVKWGNFEDFGNYSEKADSLMNLIEIKGSTHEKQYALALSQGWHISPCYNEDNHSGKWTTVSPAVTVALAPSLTRQNILEAFEKNRTYSTLDKTLRVSYTVDGYPMGSRINTDGTLDVMISVTTELDTGLGTVMLIGEDGVTVERNTVGNDKSLVWSFTVPADHDYYYVKVQSDKSWCVTSPVWVEDDTLEITSLSQQTSDGEEPYSVSFDVLNNSDTDMTDAFAELYLSGDTGFFATKLPYKTVRIDDIPAGGKASVSASTVLSQDKGSRLTVKVTASCGGRVYTAQEYTALCEAYVTEACFNSGGGKFDFIEIYNNSPDEINLNGWSLRVYPKAGASAEQLEDNTRKLGADIVKPYETVVICFGSVYDGKLDDFNEYFGTSLTADEVIFVNATQLPQENSIQAELMHGTAIVGCIRANWGDSNKNGFKTGRSEMFSYARDTVLTSSVSASNAVPTPGALAEGQVPAHE